MTIAEDRKVAELIREAWKRNGYNRFPIDEIVVALQVVRGVERDKPCRNCGTTGHNAHNREVTP